MTWLYAVQFVAPLILIGWLAGWLVGSLARSALGFVLQVFASLAALAVVALQGIWVLPPWWAPDLYAVVLGVTARLGWHRVRPFSSTVAAASAPTRTLKRSTSRFPATAHGEGNLWC